MPVADYLLLGLAMRLAGKSTTIIDSFVRLLL